MKIIDNYPLYLRLNQKILNFIYIGEECIRRSNMNDVIFAYASATTILEIVESEFNGYTPSSNYKNIKDKMTLFTESVNNFLEKNPEPTLSDWYDTINDKKKKANFVFIKHESFSDGEISFSSYPLKWDNIPVELKNMKRCDFIPTKQDALNNVFYIQIKKGGETHD